MSEKIQPTVSVHMLESTSHEKMSDFIDNGLFIDDLAERGVNLVISNRNTFDNNQIIIPSVSTSGEVAYENKEMDSSQIDAMHVRPVTAINRPGSEQIPKLNPNALKESASKYRLYQQVLSDYQVPTYFLGADDDLSNSLSDIIENITTDNVVIKNDKGCGGTSTKIISKLDAIEWLESQVKTAPNINRIIQPEIMFGSLPEEITAVGSQDDKDLIEEARDKKLLTELRMFVVKCRDQYDVTPFLRIMQDKEAASMDSNSVSIDVGLSDELREVLETISKDVMGRASHIAGGVLHAIGAVDFYFDQHGLPHIMEANFRSPELPLTRLKPIAGRAVHKAVARTLADMVKTNEDK